MVLDETAIWASDGARARQSNVFWQDTKTHVAQLVTRDRNHPSVFGWSVCSKVKPVITNVIHLPPEMMQTLYEYTRLGLASCINSIRPGNGSRRMVMEMVADELPVNMLHYGGPDSMMQAQKLETSPGVLEYRVAPIMRPQSRWPGATGNAPMFPSRDAWKESRLRLIRTCWSRRNMMRTIAVCSTLSGTDCVRCLWGCPTPPVHRN